MAASIWKGSPSTFGPYYNEETYAWYYNEPGPNEEGNGHAVTIVGWDDNFSKENFSITPPGDGGTRPEERGVCPGPATRSVHPP